MFYRKRLIIPLIAGLLFLTSSSAFALDLESSSYRLHDPVVTGGGGNAESDNYGLSISVGRHIATGSSESESYQHFAGIVPAKNQETEKPGDLNDDDEINRKDIDILKQCLNQTTPECLAYDMNGDNVINILDIRAVIANCDCPNCICR